jgi:HK97 family phage portal protein
LPGDGYRYRFTIGKSAAGKTVDQITAMQVSAVRACVAVISETIASLPLGLYRNVSIGHEKAVKHKLYKLIHSEPNPEMTSFVFRETMMIHLLLWGNSYSQIIRNNKGEVVALYPLMPDKMKVDRDEDGRIFYKYSTDKGDTVLYKDSILHIRGMGFDGLVGYSPIAMARNAIGVAIATEDYGSKFFTNNAMPSGVMEHPGRVHIEPMEDETEEDAIIRYQKDFARRHSGENAHSIAILEDGMKFHAIGLNPQDSQFLETRKFQVEEICRIFRVPPHMIASLDRSTNNNIEEQGIDFVRHTTRPWLVRIEQSLDMFLLSETEKQDYYFRFNVDGLLRGNYESRMNGYKIGLQNGFLSVNDVRAMEDLNKIPDGDIYMVNGNMSKLSNVGEAYKD